MQKYWKGIILLVVAIFLFAYSVLSKPLQSEHLSSITTPIGILSEEPRVQVGELINSGSFSITALRVEETDKYGESVAQTGYKFVAIEIKLENTSKDTLDTSPLYARLQDSKGIVYMLFLLDGKEPELPADYVATSSQVQGWVTFEVPKNAEGLILIYEIPFSDPIQRAVIDLSQ